MTLLLASSAAWANNTAQTLPFSQDWSNAGLITANDDWSGVPGIIGYRGDGLTGANDVDARTVVADETTVDVVANIANPNTNTSGGVGEAAITNPTIALQGSGTADAPFIVLHLDTTGFSNITVAYLVRDVDGSADDTAQQVALQFRVGSSGDFTDVPAGYVADATTANAATQTTMVSVVLPAAANNVPLLQVRMITTNASGNDEWVGIDDISVTQGVLPPTNPSGVGTATPSSQGQSGTTLLTVAVTAGTNPTSTGVGVSADLSSIGGSATPAFRDDGMGGDATAGDNTFSFTATVGLGTSAGAKSLPFTISDAQARTGTGNIALTVLAPTNPAGTGVASPDMGAQSSSTTLTVTVTPGTLPASTALAVGVDLTSIGGSATQLLLDDGVAPDASAGDNIFTATVTVGAAATGGAKSFPVTITDAQARTGSTTIAFTVLGPSNPSGVASATPASVNIGEQTVIAVAVTGGTNPASTGLTVTADLTAIGGSATQALLDDGMNGDASPGDDIFSFSASIPLVTTPGVKTINVSIADAELRTGTTSTTVTVRTPTNPSAVGTASPTPVLVGAMTLLRVTVTPGDNPTSSGIAVAADLTTIGGSASQQLFDDGTNGDVTGGDNVFSFNAAVAGGTSLGAKTLPVVVTDAQNRMTSASIALTVQAGSGPVGVGAATPSSLIAGAGTLLTVTVTPGSSPTSTGLTVAADLTSIGGSATAAFFDDASNGDVTAGDNVFSLQTTVAGGTTPGVKSLTATIGDDQARSGVTSIALTVLAPSNPSGVGAANPATAQAGAMTLLTVAVTPGANPTSTGLGVSVNLSSIGGSATQAFFDDATNGDVTAGDNTFSFRATIAPATAAGTRGLNVTITDAQARTGTTSITLTVTAAPTNPTITTSANPNLTTAGSQTLLAVAVTPGTNPTSTAIAVQADLQAIGGSATQAFLDDGQNGDALAGDNIFSFRATIAGGTSAGAKTLPVMVMDGQARTASGSIALTVSVGTTGPVAAGTATPSSVLPGAQTLIAVTITPGTNPASTGITGTVDLTGLGGSATQALFDDGSNGDATASDGVYSFRATVAGGISAGQKSLPVSVSDAQARTGSTSITITVLPTPSNPTAVGAANPAMVAVGGTSLLTVTVTPGNNPTSTGLAVTGNLTAIGGSATQAFRDDGMMGDVTASDRVFSFNATVPAATATGVKSLPVTVTDTQARTGSGTIALTVNPASATCGNHALEAGEQCDDGNTTAGDCCSATCSFEAATTTCRAAAGACDVAELCTGNSGSCPSDVKSMGVCRAAAGTCDLPEMCDGVNNECPFDAKSNQVCRPAAGACDQAEMCVSSSNECPADGFLPDNLVCGDGTTQCKAGACVPIDNGGGDSGCGCRAGGNSRMPVSVMLALALFGVVLVVRRRRRK
ncbi:MAG: hypothetical protein IT370_12015 [Deltaproteobacteria bacterium]|nr:hypothetical protein [Deltaproteobacteria bacterium]